MKLFALPNDRSSQDVMISISAFVSDIAPVDHDFGQSFEELWELSTHLLGDEKSVSHQILPSVGFRLNQTVKQIDARHVICCENCISCRKTFTRATYGSRGCLCAAGVPPMCKRMCLCRASLSPRSYPRNEFFSQTTLGSQSCSLRH